MLSSEKNDLLYLLNILEYIGKIGEYTKEANDAESLYELNEQLNLNASLTLLSNIGENVARLSDALKQEYDAINWREIKSFRNRIVHDYIGIDLYVVFEIIKNDLKILKTAIEQIVKTKAESGIFDTQEIAISKGSQYYRHISFDKIL